MKNTQRAVPSSSKQRRNNNQQVSSLRPPRLAASFARHPGALSSPRLPHGAGGHRRQATGSAVPVGPVAGLDQDQEPGRASGDPIERLRRSASLMRCLRRVRDVVARSSKTGGNILRRGVMADIKWEIKAREFAHCNCLYGCPCQFNGRPTQGHCQALVGRVIDEGYHGSTRLDGLKAAAAF